MIGVSFYLVTASTIRLVGDSLFADTVKTGMTSAAELSAMLGEQYPREDADAFYHRLIQAARSGGGRLLVVDLDGKALHSLPVRKRGKLKHYASTALWNTFLPLRIFTPSRSISSVTA